MRSRRNIESEADESIQQYNVTMPSVNWGLSFGDDNITTSMARNVLNSFDIINGEQKSLKHKINFLLMHIVSRSV